MQRARVRVRLATSEDTLALLVLQAACHESHLHESGAVFASIVAQQLSFVATCAADGDDQCVGYALVHAGDSAALGAVCDDHDGAADAGACFLHDVVVLARCRGGGVASQLVREALRHAARSGFHEVHLVALTGTASFWRRQRFSEQECGGYADAASYGPGALHMRLRLQSVRDEYRVKSCCDDKRVGGDAAAAIRT